MTRGKNHKTIIDQKDCFPTGLSAADGEKSPKLLSAKSFRKTADKVCAGAEVAFSKEKYRATFPMSTELIFRDFSPPRLQNRHSQNHVENMQNPQFVERHSQMAIVKHHATSPKMHHSNRSKHIYENHYPRENRNTTLFKSKFSLAKLPVHLDIKKRLRSIIYVAESPEKEADSSSCDISECSDKQMFRRASKSSSFDNKYKTYGCIEHKELGDCGQFPLCREKDKGIKHGVNNLLLRRTTKTNDRSKRKNVVVNSGIEFELNRETLTADVYLNEKRENTRSVYKGTTEEYGAFNHIPDNHQDVPAVPVAKTNVKEKLISIDLSRLVHTPRKEKLYALKNPSCNSRAGSKSGRRSSSSTKNNCVNSKVSSKENYDTDRGQTLKKNQKRRSQLYRPPPPRLQMTKKTTSKYDQRREHQIDINSGGKRRYAFLDMQKFEQGNQHIPLAAEEKLMTNEGDNIKEPPKKTLFSSPFNSKEINKTHVGNSSESIIKQDCNSYLLESLGKTPFIEQKKVNERSSLFEFVNQWHKKGRGQFAYGIGHSVKPSANILHPHAEGVNPKKLAVGNHALIGMNKIIHERDSSEANRERVSQPITKQSPQSKTSGLQDKYLQRQRTPKPSMSFCKSGEDALAVRQPTITGEKNTDLESHTCSKGNDGRYSENQIPNESNMQQSSAKRRQIAGWLGTSMFSSADHFSDIKDKGILTNKMRGSKTSWSNSYLSASPSNKVETPENAEISHGFDFIEDHDHGNCSIKSASEIRNTPLVSLNKESVQQVTPSETFSSVFSKSREHKKSNQGQKCIQRGSPMKLRNSQQSLGKNDSIAMSKDDCAPNPNPGKQKACCQTHLTKPVKNNAIAKRFTDLIHDNSKRMVPSQVEIKCPPKHPSEKTENSKRQGAEEVTSTYTAKYLEGKGVSYFSEFWKDANAIRKRLQLGIKEKDNQASKVTRDRNSKHAGGQNKSDAFARELLRNEKKTERKDHANGEVVKKKSRKSFLSRLKNQTTSKSDKEKVQKQAESGKQQVEKCDPPNEHEINKRSQQQVNDGSQYNNIPPSLSVSSFKDKYSLPCKSDITLDAYKFKDKCTVPCQSNTILNTIDRTSSGKSNVNLRPHLHESKEKNEDLAHNQSRTNMFQSISDILVIKDVRPRVKVDPAIKRCISSSFVSGIIGNKSSFFMNIMKPKISEQLKKRKFTETMHFRLQKLSRARPTSSKTPRSESVSKLGRNNQKYPVSEFKGKEADNGIHDGKFSSRRNRKSLSETQCRRFACYRNRVDRRRPSVSLLDISLNADGKQDVLISYLPCHALPSSLSYEVCKGPLPKCEEKGVGGSVKSNSEPGNERTLESDQNQSVGEDMLAGPSTSIMTGGELSPTEVFVGTEPRSTIREEGNSDGILTSWIVHKDDTLAVGQTTSAAAFINDYNICTKELLISNENFLENPITNVHVPDDKEKLKSSNKSHTTLPRISAMKVLTKQDNSCENERNQRRNHATNQLQTKRQNRMQHCSDLTPMPLSIDYNPMVSSISIKHPLRFRQKVNKMKLYNCYNQRHPRQSMCFKRGQSSFQEEGRYAFDSNKLFDGEGQNNQICPASSVHVESQAGQVCVNAPLQSCSNICSTCTSFKFTLSDKNAHEAILTSYRDRRDLLANKPIFKAICYVKKIYLKFPEGYGPTQSQILGVGQNALPDQHRNNCYINNNILPIEGSPSECLRHRNVRINHPDEICTVKRFEKSDDITSNDQQVVPLEISGKGREFSKMYLKQRENSSGDISTSGNPFVHDLESLLQIHIDNRKLGHDSDRSRDFFNALKTNRKCRRSRQLPNSNHDTDTADKSKKARRFLCPSSGAHKGTKEVRVLHLDTEDRERKNMNQLNILSKSYKAKDLETLADGGDLKTHTHSVKRKRPKLESLREHLDNVMNGEKLRQVMKEIKNNSVIPLSSPLHMEKRVVHPTIKKSTCSRTGCDKMFLSNHLHLITKGDEDGFHFIKDHEKIPKTASLDEQTESEHHCKSPFQTATSITRAAYWNGEKESSRVKTSIAPTPATTDSNSVLQITTLTSNKAIADTNKYECSSSKGRHNVRTVVSSLEISTQSPLSNTDLAVLADDEASSSRDTDYVRTCSLARGEKSIHGKNPNSPAINQATSTNETKEQSENQCSFTSYYPNSQNKDQINEIDISWIETTQEDARTDINIEQLESTDRDLSTCYNDKGCDIDIDLVSRNSSDITLSWANSSQSDDHRSLESKVNNNENNATQIDEQSDISSNSNPRNADSLMGKGNLSFGRVHDDSPLVSKTKIPQTQPWRRNGQSIGFCRSHVADDIYEYILREDEDTYW